MKKKFAYNIIEKKDQKGRDIQWWEDMSDGTQLVIPLNESDTGLKALLGDIEKLMEAYKESDVAFIPIDKAVTYRDSCEKAIPLVNAKMPRIVINLDGYVKTSALTEVDKEDAANFYCFSSTEDHKGLSIAWNICDICGAIARVYRKSDRLIPLTKKTHITDLKIEQDKDGYIIITPTIENK